MRLLPRFSLLDRAVSYPPAQSAGRGNAQSLAAGCCRHNRFAETLRPCSTCSTEEWLPERLLDSESPRRQPPRRRSRRGVSRFGRSSRPTAHLAYQSNESGRDEVYVRPSRSQRNPLCAYKAHSGIVWSVPTSVPKRGPMTIMRQPTPTKVPIKNGPEIINFGPVLGSPAALANRRFRPLSHLTVKIFLTISAIHRWLIRLCNAVCSSSPNLRSFVHVDGGFADHRLVNDSIPTIASSVFWPTSQLPRIEGPLSASNSTGKRLILRARDAARLLELSHQRVQQLTQTDAEIR